MKNCPSKLKFNKDFQSLKRLFKKKILITGHTGFKGSWLTLWLLSLVQRFMEFQDIPTNPSHYKELNISKKAMVFFETQKKYASTNCKND